MLLRSSALDCQFARPHRVIGPRAKPPGDVNESPPLRRVVLRVLQFLITIRRRIFGKEVKGPLGHRKKPSSETNMKPIISINILATCMRSVVRLGAVALLGGMAIEVGRSETITRTTRTGNAQFGTNVVNTFTDQLSGGVYQAGVITETSSRVFGVTQPSMVAKVSLSTGTSGTWRAVGSTRFGDSPHPRG